MNSKSDPKCGIMNMTIEALDVEELEQRLELATQAAACDCCGEKAEGCLGRSAATAVVDAC